MKKLIFLSILGLSLAGNGITQQNSRASLSTRHRILPIERYQSFPEMDSVKQFFDNQHNNTPFLKGWDESQERLDSVVYYNYSSEDDSVRLGKVEFSYDAAGNQTLSIWYGWETHLIDWKGKDWSPGAKNP